MKKILTTTVMTAILATSGFALQAEAANDTEAATSSTDAVKAYVYDVFDFLAGTDTEATTIMPSGTINIGNTDESAVTSDIQIASKWILQEGATMNVTGKGFVLSNELKINPKDAKETYVQCDIKKSGTLYYKYEYDGGYIYRLVSDPNAKYVEADGETEVTPTSPPKQVKTTTITGVPQLDSGAIRDNAVIDIFTINSDGTTTTGCISGGSVTYAKATDPILSEDSTSLSGTSLKDITGNQYKLDKAAENGFTEGYIKQFPTLFNGDSQMSIDLSTMTLPSSDLKTYLNGFGFYPDEVSISKSNIELLTTKGKDDAILVPTDYGFKKNALGTGYDIQIKANLHNVGQEFNTALTFEGTVPEDCIPDTLIFSGDNSNLVPEKGLTYTDVNVTFECKNSWIEPKDGGISFIGNSTKPTLSMNADTSISQTLTVSHANLSIGSKNIVKILGTLNLN